MLIKRDVYKSRFKLKKVVVCEEVITAAPRRGGEERERQNKNKMKTM